MRHHRNLARLHQLACGKAGFIIIYIGSLTVAEPIHDINGGLISFSSNDKVTEVGNRLMVASKGAGGVRFGGGRWVGEGYAQEEDVAIKGQQEGSCGGRTLLYLVVVDTRTYTSDKTAPTKHTHMRRQAKLRETELRPLDYSNVDTLIVMFY